MATLKLQSTGRDFSFVIRKNPASGMSAKNIRKGTAFGWYSSPEAYCVAFFDGMDELSFAKKQNEEFAFLDRTRYNAPLFLSVAIREFFQTALRKWDEEKDIPGSCHTLEVSSIEIGRMTIFQKLMSCFQGFHIEAVPIPHNMGSTEQEENYDNYTLKITTETKTLHELLNLGYLLGYLAAICSRVEFQTEQGIISRLVDACNLLHAPYYIKYMIKARCIHTLEDFRKAENGLNASTEHQLKFCPDTNTNARFQWVRSRIFRDMDIVDFGCGEGRFFPLAENISSSTYYAIDRDEGKREAARKSALRREFDNVIVLESMEAFLGLDTDRDFLVVMSEVFEHNKAEDMGEVLRGMFRNPHCAEILLTTPNRDFNAFYFLKEGEMRHEDHVFEMTEGEVRDYFTKLVQGTDYSCRFYRLGDEVDGISAILGVTLVRNSGEEALS